MAVKLVINGYFRSGTTIVWSALKKANDNFDVFYEPCHGELLKHLDDAKISRDINTLHGLYLWDEYLSDEAFIEKLKLTHPNIGQSFPIGLSDLEKYVSVYHECSDLAILQSNRWHFHLQFISSTLNCGVIHVIRSPLKVYESMRKKHLSETKNMTARVVKKILLPLVNGNVFELNQFYEYLFWRYSRNISPFTTRLNLQKMRWSMFEKFIFVWTLSNYEAIKQVDHCGGEVLVFEKMERDPCYAQKIFEKHSICFDVNQIKINNTAKFLIDTNNSKLMQAVKNVGVEEEFDYIFMAVTDG